MSAPTPIERETVIPSILHQKRLAAVRRLIVNAGRQSFTWNLGRATRREVDADGCNWTIYLNASMDIIRIAQPAIEDAKQRYNLKLPSDRRRFKQAGIQTSKCGPTE